MEVLSGTLEENLESFHEKLSKSLFRETITLNSFALRVWYEYKQLLPIEPFYIAWNGNNPPMQYAKLVEHWIDFFIATPKEAEACWKELRTIIAKASRAVNGKPHTTYSLNEQKEGRALLKKQINRLPPNF